MFTGVAARIIRNRLTIIRYFVLAVGRECPNNISDCGPLPNIDCTVYGGKKFCLCKAGYSVKPFGLQICTVNSKFSTVYVSLQNIWTPDLLLLS